MNSMKHYSHHSSMGDDLYPAIRIEALRSLVRKGGDVNHMATTKLYEEPDYTMSMQLEEFGVGNKTKFMNAAKKMMSFFMAENDPELSAKLQSSKHCPLCNCMDIDKAAHAVTEAAYLDSNGSPSANTTTHSNRGRLLSTKQERQEARAGEPLATHITHNMMTSEEKKVYKERLLNDPILGKLLQLLNKIIYTPTPPRGSKRMIDV
jgi:hypothetical protein